MQVLNRQMQQNFIVLSALTAILTVVLTLTFKRKDIFDYFMIKPQYQLVLGVLSSRDHFEQRQTIRNTWIKPTLNNQKLHNRVLVKFVVSSQDCRIPPQYRTDIYTCKEGRKWGELATGFDLGLLSAVNCHSIPYNEHHKIVAIDFYIAHPVVVSALAIPSGYFHADTPAEFVTIELRDLANENQLVLSATFNLQSTNREGGCSVKRDVPKYVLPKGFHGTILIHCPKNSKSGWRCLGNKADTRLLEHPAVQYSPLYRYGEHEDELPVLVIPTEISELLIPAFLIFEIHGTEALENHIETKTFAYRAWKERLGEIEMQLNHEHNLHGDIVFVDHPGSDDALVDVYRNLPFKLLSFYAWSFENHKSDFVGKVDDDCYVDLEEIVQELDLHASTYRASLWLGNFRVNLGVDRWGKWADVKYTAPVYPAFACGSGNVISRDVCRWLADNAARLHGYQGEDVSMGIWLSAIAPVLKQNDMWVCDDACRPQMLVSAQHNSSAIARLWKHKRMCGNPCSCATA